MIWDIITHALAFLLGALVWFEFLWILVKSNEKRG